MSGEKIDYQISFLWFNRMADGRLTFSEGGKEGTYVAMLEARTRGSVALLTRDMMHRYVSAMEKNPAGGFRSVSHEAQVTKGKGKRLKERTKRYLFDHEQRLVHYQRTREQGEIYHDEVLPMDGPAPNDILTAMFNFRTGVFGPIRQGAKYLIPTFSHKGTGNIEIEVLGNDERAYQDFFPEGGFLCRVQVDREIFETGDGAIYVWFDDQGRPARGIVENVIGLGNVRGVLQE